MQDEKYIRARITELRIKKNVSEYRMSLDLGHSDSYIRAITSGRALPSMSEFLYMCDYLGVTPKEFFDEKTDNPILLGRLCEAANGLSDEDMTALLTMAERLGKIINKRKSPARAGLFMLFYAFTASKPRSSSIPTAFLTQPSQPSIVTVFFSSETENFSPASERAFSILATQCGQCIASTLSTVIFISFPPFGN